MLQKEKELQFRFEGDEMVVIVDIGGETLDIIPVDSIRIQRDECRIETKAGIWLTRTIAERINAELYEDIPEAKILQYLLKGSRENQPANKYEEIMRDTAVEYCSQVYRILKEYKLNPLVVPVIFAGGGAGIIKRFGEYNPKMTDFIEDLKANAIGYEYLDELYYARKQG